MRNRRKELRTGSYELLGRTWSELVLCRSGISPDICVILRHLGLSDVLDGCAAHSTVLRVHKPALYPAVVLHRKER